METKDRISVTIVDRNYPPNKSVIAESASDLAKHLIDQKIDVHVVHTDGNYQGGGADGIIVGNTHKVPSIYNGKQKLIRLISSLIEGFLLIKKAKKINKGVIIVMTSPPLLNFWASILLRKKKIPWIYWSMDVYPQAFIAGNLITEKSTIYKYFYNKTYDYPPVGMIALGEIQAKYLEDHFHKKIDKTILPCGVFLNQKNGSATDTSTPVWRTDESKIYLGYVGNLGEAHSVDFLKHIIDHLDESRHKVIFVLYGSKANFVIDYIKSKKSKAIVLLDFVPRQELKYIDIHLVSLEPSWVNICVPSKMVSAVHKGSIFLFYGIKDCDSWRYLNKAGWIIEKSDKDAKNIKDFLTTLDIEMIDNKKAEADSMPQLLQDNTEKAYDEIVEMIHQKTNKYFEWDE